MSVPGVAFLGKRNRFSSRPVECFILVIALALVSVLTTSCGLISPASGSNNSLALSGALPSGTVSQPYNAVLSVGGGSSPYQFSLRSGSLPPGLALNTSTGSFTGTPTATGIYSFQIQVTDTPLADQGTSQFRIIVSQQGTIRVMISPTSVTLGSGGTQLFTANVVGTPDTAVSWSASAGSVTSGGFYTAPAVQTQTSVLVTATSQADPSRSATSTVTVNPGQQGQLLQISTSGLPQALQGDAYQAAFTATGGTQPYSWTITAGNLPAGIGMNTSGDLTGTPTAVGSSNFTVTVTDATSKTASGNFSLTVVASNGYDGPAQLPLVTVAVTMADSPAPGSVVSVNAGDDLQAAFDNAKCGQTLQLQAGATFSGDYTIRAKSCDDNHWIIIRTSSPDSSLPAEGQRLTPCYGGVSSLEGRPAYNCPNPKNVLAKVQMNRGGDGPIQFADGANFYRFIGLEITRESGVRGDARLVSLQGTADHIILDRVWEHGQPQDETKNGFQASGGTYIAVVDSYLNDFHCISKTGVCTDSHAISGGTSDTQDGPYLIRNNFLEASGEEVLFGGGAATMTPADITVQYNHFWKPWQWMPGNPKFVGGQDGSPFIVKNHFELKNAVRVLVENNLMENNWGGFSQNGYSILLTPANQHTRSGRNVCPLCQVTDVTIRYNQLSHAGAGIQFAEEIQPNKQEGAPALQGTRFSLHDLVIDDLSKNYNGGGTGFEIDNAWPKNPLNTITINHVTVFPDSGGHMMITGNISSNPVMYGLIFTNNLIVTGRYPIWNSLGSQDSCSNDDVPLTTITQCFGTFNFSNNGLIASPKQFPPSSWPSPNWFPTTANDVLFVNYNNGNGGNYALQAGSPYKNKGTDGKDLGADIAGLNQALVGVE